MAIYTGLTDDQTTNGYLVSIRNADFGSDARAPMAGAIQRCYEIAKIHAGGARVPQAAITTMKNLVLNSVYGDDVRTAFKNGIRLCYDERGIEVTVGENANLNDMIYAQTGEDLKNNILKSIVKCYQDVR